jgi:fructose-1,6-bisphosphatase
MSEEKNKRLDEVANEIFISCLKNSGQCAIMVSEEEENIIEIE